MDIPRKCELVVLHHRGFVSNPCGEIVLEGYNTTPGGVDLRGVLGIHSQRQLSTERLREMLGLDRFPVAEPMDGGVARESTFADARLAGVREAYESFREGYERRQTIERLEGELERLRRLMDAQRRMMDSRQFSIDREALDRLVAELEDER